MHLDLTHPRTLLPLSTPTGASTSTSSSKTGNGVRDAGGTGGTAPGGRQAIHLKLTEEMVAQLMNLARNGGADGGKLAGGGIKLDLGADPVPSTPSEPVPKYR